MRNRRFHSKAIRTILIMMVGASLPYNWAKADSLTPISQTQEDPFAEMDGSQLTSIPTYQSVPPKSFWDQFFAENFTFKKEAYLQVSHGPQQTDSDQDINNRWYSRQSVGFETLKKFSTQTSTVASFNFQGRMVRRDNFIPVINDEEGGSREGWFFEYHNAYFDLYNILNPLLDDQQRGSVIGNFNFRIGRFYLPFGINLQTDTHGTLLQLSNERNFGFERDWYAGFWGSINRDLNYDLYYMLGAGYDPSFKGQDGLLGGRVSLADAYLNDFGLQGGVSVLAGQRRSGHALDRSVAVSRAATDGEFIQTKRFGVDTRYTHLVPSGSLTGTVELSTGKDESEVVFTHLSQLEYLNRSRKWGIGSQYRRFHQNISQPSPTVTNEADSSVIGELTWFFRNDIGNTNLHWIKFNIEKQLERMEGKLGAVTTIQYYHYW